MSLGRRSHDDSSSEPAARRWRKAIFAQLGVVVQSEIAARRLQARTAIDRAAAERKESTLVPKQRPRG